MVFPSAVSHCRCPDLNSLVSSIPFQGERISRFGTQDHFYPQNWLCDVREGDAGGGRYHLLKHSRQESFYRSIVDVLRRKGNVQEAKLR